MRTLSLIRHAEAAWGDANLSDFDRPLNAQGRCTVPQMGQHFLGSGIVLQKIMSSSAKRAQQTTALLVLELGLSTAQIEEQAKLYLAEPDRLLDVIATCPDVLQHIAVVAHNPGIAALAMQLTQQQLTSFPPCSILTISFQKVSWSSLKREKGHVLYHENSLRVANIARKS